MREYLKRDALECWNVLPEWLRVPAGLLAGMCAGSVLFVLSFVPFKSELMVFADSTIRGRVVPFLSRIAAARGIRRLTPDAWREAPDTWRTKAERKYLHLWWWTMRRLIRKRMAIGRRMHERHLRRLEEHKEKGKDTTSS